MEEDHQVISIRRHPLWFWLLGAGWLLLEVLLVQTALASHRESEPRAALISWCLAAALAAAGLWVWRRH